MQDTYMNKSRLEQGVIFSQTGKLIMVGGQDTSGGTTVLEQGVIFSQTGKLIMVGDAGLEPATPCL